jgi:hypothetical protein
MSKNSKPTWQILIATVGIREASFRRLLDVLLPQTNENVTILAHWNNFETNLGHIRQTLVEEATADYISFIDDDDLVPQDYVTEIYPHLDRDYVGFKLKFYDKGVEGKVAIHSLKHSGWYEDENYFYRDLSCLNPIKRELALQARYDTSMPEDVSWSSALRGKVKTERFLDKYMYYYYSDADKSVWKTAPELPERLVRPNIKHKYFSYHNKSKKEFTK